MLKVLFSACLSYTYENHEKLTDTESKVVAIDVISRKTANERLKRVLDLQYKCKEGILSTKTNFLEIVIAE